MIDSMSIWTPPGYKVRFSEPKAGLDSDRKKVIQLEIDEIYTIYKIVVKDCFTWVYLEGFEGTPFNSCHFENAEPLDPEVEASRTMEWNKGNLDGLDDFEEGLL